MNTRKRRIWYPGAIYHIMQRGNRRQEIFRSEDDYLYFMELIRRELKRCNCIVHAYCLMTNHYHILLETKSIEIWKFMKNVSQQYARYFNCKYSYQGHLFEGRYVSEVIEDEVYFLQVSRYIHLNPVKAHICLKADSYPYSSFRSYMDMENDRITFMDRTRSYFSNDPIGGYRSFVDNAGDEFLEHEKYITDVMEGIV